MSRFPLGGLVRTGVVALCAAAMLSGTNLTATAHAPTIVPANAPGARFAAYVQTAEADAWACRLSGGPGVSGLQTWPAAVRARVAAEFGVAHIGGYRPGHGKSDHHSGHALDIMIRGQKGTEIADWFRANARDLNVKYVIWEQGYWHPGMRAYRPMADRGSDTANHWDHVHVSFHPGSGTCPA
ncbi:MAG: hypothetical protein Q4G43_04835 [Mobilicoccus sp.]|nr:hypothetical protein [Mobilicoccus sp.]